MRKLLPILALVLASPLSAQSADAKAVMATVNQFVNGFNKGDTKNAAAACAEQTSIIDEFPPHEWHGKGSCLAWMNDYASDATKNGITDGVVTLTATDHADVNGDRAYVVTSANYDFKKKGKPVKETNSKFTFALQKQAAGWRITGWSWAKH